MAVSEATLEDRLAYRLIVSFGAGHLVCPGTAILASVGHCPHGNPGCPLMDWLMRFDELGWIDLFGDLP